MPSTTLKVHNSLKVNTLSVLELCSHVAILTLEHLTVTLDVMNSCMSRSFTDTDDGGTDIRQTCSKHRF